MRRTLVSLALVSLAVPLSLAGCESGDDGELDGIAEGETVGDGDTGDGDTNGDANGDGDGDPDAGTDTDDPVGCNAESPYMAGWDIGCCQDEPVPNGWSPGGVYAGTIMPDWTLTDQFVRLYDFCHEAIYFEYVALW
jgi:hypothetical protein